MKAIFRKYTLLISLIIIWKFAGSCYYEPFEMNRVCLFDPETSIVSDYLRPFFYTNDLLYDNSVIDWKHIPEENINEWSDYFKGKVKKEDIKKTVYRTSLDDLIELHEVVLGNKKKKYLDNELARYIIKNKNVLISNYLIFAKRTEQLLGEGDPWYGTNYNTSALNDLIKQAKEKVKTSNDKMMMQRYAYQAIVIMRYLKQNLQAEEYYNKIFSDIRKKDESILKYWALSHVASCQHLLGKKRDSQLNFVKVFANCHAKKFWAYQQINLKYIKLLGHDATKEEYYNIKLYEQFRNPGRALAGLRAVVSHNPNSDLFITLMIRELNKIEDWLLTPKFTGSSPAIAYWNMQKEKTLQENWNSDFEYLDRFIQFTENTLNKYKIEKKGLWALMLAHLCYIHKQPEKAFKYLKIAEKNIDNDKEKSQIKYTKVLLKIITAKKIDEKFEKETWNIINSIVKEGKTSYKKREKFSDLMLALHQTYHKNKMYVKSAMFLQKIIGYDYYDIFYYLDKFASEEQVKEFIDICENKNKSKTEEFLLKEYKYDKNRYLDLLGTIMLRKDDLKAALKYYKEVPDSFWTKEYSYAYYLNRDPYIYFRNVFYVNKRYNDIYINKAYFVNSLIDKKNKYEKSKGNEKAKLAIELGNAYSNMSYEGRSWYYLAYIQGYLFTEYNDFINIDYRTNLKAIDYYDKAQTFAKDKNLQAQILFYLSGIQTKKEAKKSIVKLKTDYTENYNRYLKTCPDIKYY